MEEKNKTNKQKTTTAPPTNKTKQNKPTHYCFWSYCSFPENPHGKISFNKTSTY